MSPTVIRSVVALALTLSFADTAVAGDKAAAEKVARDVVAKFEKGDPGWKVRMGALVELAKQGPATAPVLAEALKKGSPSARGFAAQALVLLAEPGTRLALEQALDDPDFGVRVHAIQALSMFGRLEPNERHKRILREDPSFFG